MIIFKLIVAFTIMGSLFTWLVISARKQVLKDWDTLKELKKKANEVKTKEEIEEFHKEFVEKASKIHNRLITPELYKINGYLIGLYKQFEK